MVMDIVDWIFPKMCSGCRREGEYICDNCQKKMIKPEQICPMCCKPSIDGWTHPRCRRHDGMERLLVGLPYKGVVQQCLKKVKYKSAWDIISFLFEIWSKNCSDTVSRDMVITCVPMWREKEHQRGFNQAELISTCVAEKNKGRTFVFLERTRETKPMFGLKKKERQANIAGAFRLVRQYTNAKIQESVVILVDDVWTTGATMRECARILKQAGAKEIWGVALAR